MSHGSLQMFEDHGVIWRGEQGNQKIGDCPFTGKRSKLYVNSETFQWDSKTGGVSGNSYTFLSEIAKLNVAGMTDEAIANLVENRQLPPAAFTPWDVGFDGHQYTIPIRNANGTVTDIRRLVLGKKIRATSGGKLGLLGMDVLSKTDPSVPVYLCEGEWDAMAMLWLLRKNRKKGVVVAVPGASIFKTEWVEYFMGRDVTVMYDNDHAGIQGEKTVVRRIGSVVNSIRFVHWPSNYPEGSDVRDWVVYGAYKRRTFKTCLSKLMKLVSSKTRYQTTEADHVPENVQKEQKTLNDKRSKLKPITREEMLKSYRKWLTIEDEDCLAVMFGSFFANIYLSGDPLWMFLTARPGGMKSELIMSLELCDKVYAVSSLTPRTLVSGMAGAGGADPSLLGRIDGMMLAIKDFTTILGMNYVMRDEIFAQLRDAYDGKFSKEFGNGIIRRYDSKFGIIAGVTPKIDAYEVSQQGLGERFLKFRMDENLSTSSEVDRIMKAMDNVNKEVQMREDLKTAGASFLLNKPSTAIVIPEKMLKEIAHMAVLFSRMRGDVSRDRYNYEIMNSKAFSEIGTRMSKQLIKLMMGLCMYYGVRKPTKKIFKIVAKVGIDSILDKRAEVLKALYRLTPGEEDTIGTTEIAGHIPSLSIRTIERTLQDLKVLGAVQQSGKATRKEWFFTKDLRDIIEQTGLWS